MKPTSWPWVVLTLTVIALAMVALFGEHGDRLGVLAVAVLLLAVRP